MDVKVSVLCVTYNQKDYIRGALDGFLSQKTDFDFEILVHDDCSTDGTADIIREYEEKYPDKVRGVYATENTFMTNGGRYFSRRLAPIAKADILAYCEGDDYWTDDNKLQRQYDYLCAHPDCMLYTHRARMVDGTTEEDIGFIGPSESGVLSFEDILSNWSTALPENGTWLLSTASFCVRKDICINFDKDWSFRTTVGDLALALYAADKGEVYYDATPLSVYRYQTHDSWSAKARRNKTDKRYNYVLVMHDCDTIEMAINIDEATGGRHHDVLCAYEQKYACYLLQVEGLIGYLRNHKEQYGSMLTPAMWVRGVLGNHYLQASILLFKLGFEVVKDPSGRPKLQRAQTDIAEPDTGLEYYDSRE